MFETYKEEYSEAREEILNLNKEIKNLKIDKDREIVRIQEKHTDEISRINAVISTKIVEKTSLLKEQVSTLTIEKQVSDQKVKMYEKAFENLGFDVKDMKDILNKLVDGVVAKNQIQMIGAPKN